MRIVSGPARQPHVGVLTQSQILQLTSLLPTAEHFSILLRDALKAQIPSMKLLKAFHPSLYSEYLLAQGEDDNEADARGPGGDGKGTYARGLGETFGYPGDAKRLREKSKMKLWKEYFTVHGRNLTRQWFHPYLPS
jgi:hypothetical protein